MSVNDTTRVTMKGTIFCGTITGTCCSEMCGYVPAQYRMSDSSAPRILQGQIEQQQHTWAEDNVFASQEQAMLCTLIGRCQVEAHPLFGCIVSEQVIKGIHEDTSLPRRFQPGRAHNGMACRTVSYEISLLTSIYQHATVSGSESWWSSFNI